jgi:aromatic-L-amino-acid decarboxylase
LIPFWICATLGTTSTCSFDDLPGIHIICYQHQMWLHVDAAFAGSALICPEYRNLMNGIEYADSFCFNMHKWMLVNFDCSTLFVKQRVHLINALSISATYLQNKATDSGMVFDYRDWQVPLGMLLFHDHHSVIKFNREKIPFS